jgi:hypothetical protein
MLEHRVGRVKPFDRDGNECLLGLFPVVDFALIESAPFGAAAHGIDGGQVERVAGDPRSRGREEGRGGVLATFPDDGVEPDVRDQRPRIGKAGEMAQFPQEGAGGIRAHPGQGLQQGGIRWTPTGFAGGSRACKL